MYFQLINQLQGSPPLSQKGLVETAESSDEEENFQVLVFMQMILSIISTCFFGCNRFTFVNLQDAISGELMDLGSNNLEINRSNSEAWYALTNEEEVCSYYA